MMARVRRRLRAKVQRKITGLVRRKRRIDMDNFLDENSTLYTTIFENQADVPWRVLEKGDDLIWVEPHNSLKIESFKTTVSWSRWSKVVRGKDLRLAVTENPAWSNPWEGNFHCLELINEDGSAEESIQVLVPNPEHTSANGYITVYRDVPKIVPLNIWDELIRYQNIIWHKKEVRVPIEGTKYFKTEIRVVKECVPRGKGELKDVLRARQKIEVEQLKERQEKIEAEREAAMKEQERLLMES
jgi:hypothetical protein